MAPALLLFCTMVASAALLYLLLAAEGSLAEPTGRPPPPTLPVDVEMQSGLDAPLGPLGVVFVAHWWRLSLGGGLGFVLRDHDDGLGRVVEDFGVVRGRRQAWFVGFDLLARDRYRLALRVGGSGGYGGRWTQGVFGDATLSWGRQHIDRHDLSVVAEAGLGPVWLGAQFGVGHFTAPLRCELQDATTQGGPCAAGETRGKPSNWIPFLGLTLRHRDTAAAEADGAGVEPSAAGTRREMRLSLAGSTVVDLDYYNDYAADHDPLFSGRVEGALLWHLGRYLRLGPVLRYELTRGISYTDRSTTDHFVSLPLLMAADVPLAIRHDLEISLAVGLTVGVLNESLGQGSRFATAFGPTAEVGLAYWVPATRQVDLSVGLALTTAMLTESHPSDHGPLFQTALPFRLSARWPG